MVQYGSGSLVPLSFPSSSPAPAAVTARRTGQQLRIDVWQPKVESGGIAPLVNAGIDWIDHRLDRQPNHNGGPYPYGGFFK